MFLKISTKHNNIVQVDQARLPLQSSKNKFHKPLKRTWRITETKGHYLEFKEAMTGRECCLLMVSTLHLDLPITAGQIPRTTSCWCNVTRLSACFIGGESHVSIWCLTTPVLPRSAGPDEKMSAYSSKSVFSAVLCPPVRSRESRSNLLDTSGCVVLRRIEDNRRCNGPVCGT